MSRAVIMAAVGGSRPAVIAARQDQVELVAALRAHLGLPQPPVGREGEAEQVAVAHACNESARRSRWPSGGHVDDLAEVARSGPAPGSNWTARRW